MRKQLEAILATLPISERISLLESLCKKYRRENSVRINSMQMGRRVDDDRPDLLSLKDR